jgi:NTE family protein
MFRVDRLIRRQFFGDATAQNGPRGISSVMIDAFNITQDRIARSRLAGDPPDVMISPKLGNIGLFEFHNAKRAIQLGEEATERALGDLNHAVAALL